MQILIATSSVNRINLFQKMKFQFDAIAPDFEEILDPKKSNIQNIESLALGKANSVQEKIKNNQKKYNFQETDYIIFGFDSMVVLGNQVIGKARDKKDAEKMLMEFVGKSQKIVSGIAAIGRFQGQNFQIVEHESTQIKFKKNITTNQIKKYLEFEDWSGKCGAYSILGTGIFFIESLEGDFQNIVGVPVMRMGNILEKVTERSPLEVFKNQI